MRLRSVLVPGVVAVVVAAGALVLGGHSGPDATGPASAVGRGSAVVTIENFAYHPDVLTVKVGTTITVTNRDMTAHTLTANDGAFDTGTVEPGQTRRVVMRRAGTYAYHCEFHAFMTGTIKAIG